MFLTDLFRSQVVLAVMWGIEFYIQKGIVNYISFLLRTQLHTNLGVY